MSTLSANLKTVPTFDETKGSCSFRLHLRKFKEWILIHNITAELDKKLGLLYSIKNQSYERIQHLDYSSEAFHRAERYEVYEKLILDVFHPRQERDLAKSEFLGRKQSASEDIGKYTSTKVALFKEAYSDGGGDFETLLTETIRGLYSPVVKRHLRRMCPQNPEEMRQYLFKIVAAERTATIEGYGESSSLDGLAATTPAVERARMYAAEDRARADREEPMEIQQMGQQYGQQFGRGHKPGGQNQKKETRRCHICQKSGHLAKQCRAKTNKPKAKCYHCGKEGHLIKDCRSRKAGRPKVNQGKLQVIDEDDQQQQQQQNYDMDEEEVVNLLQRSRIMEMSGN